MLKKISFTTLEKNYHFDIRFLKELVMYNHDKLLSPLEYYKKSFNCSRAIAFG